jgi:hypothetical protein
VELELALLDDVDESGVDHDWLRQILKTNGQLPSLPVERARRWVRLSLTASSSSHSPVRRAGLWRFGIAAAVR